MLRCLKFKLTLSNGGPVSAQVEGAKTNTPSKSNNYERLPITNFESLLLLHIFNSRGRKRHYKIFRNGFDAFFFIENHRRQQYVRSLANHGRKYSPLPKSTLWALLHPSIDPKLRPDRPPMRTPYSGIRHFMWQGLGLKHCCWVWIHQCYIW